MVVIDEQMAQLFQVPDANPKCGTGSADIGFDRHIRRTGHRPRRGVRRDHHECLAQVADTNVIGEACGDECRRRIEPA